MSAKNDEMLEEFKRLEKICRDIYGPSSEGKLPITLYIEDMKQNELVGSSTVPNWNEDYKKLIRIRTIRNKIIHGEASYKDDQFTKEDVEFISTFCQRILDGTDPISSLNGIAPQKGAIGCIVSALLFAIALAIIITVILI